MLMNSDGKKKGKKKSAEGPLKRGEGNQGPTHSTKIPSKFKRGKTNQGPCLGQKRERVPKEEFIPSPCISGGEGH